MISRGVYLEKMKVDITKCFPTEDKQLGRNPNKRQNARYKNFFVLIFLIKNVQIGGKNK